MSKLIVLVSFLAAFAAGLAVGVKWFPQAEPTTTTAPATRPDRHGSWLADQLELTPAQQEQMKKIWSEVPGRWRERGDSRRQIFRERDEAVAALIGAEHKARYEEIQRQLFEQTAVLERERQEARQRAVDQSNEAIAELLGPERRAQYEEIQKHLTEQMAGMERERQESWQRAVDQTKGILNAPQREKYEAILKGPPGGLAPGGPRGGRERRGWTREHGRLGGDRATSSPASAPENQS
jgi:Spy/CpxP family protein refolding chaperone